MSDPPQPARGVARTKANKSFQGGILIIILRLDESEAQEVPSGLTQTGRPCHFASPTSPRPFAPSNPDGRPIEIASIVDGHTRDCLGGLVERNITGDDLIGELDRLAAVRGYPVSSRFDQGCTPKTWATAPPLKAVVLIGSMVSGAVKSCSPEPRTTGWMTRRYSSIKPVLTSDRANRAPP